uniref:Uncharacterized protein AlNc14C88G5587 n=1 Tax=Albugo laibachii Nc14 TaxID=890382 RepID=F0WG57_9STRA|nr:conserved hypothetical protein [Albugo laibachii Nc14]|eukprot:CCA20192.1 conserved hypothetical protein [Albugo laibachii Nc14]
MRSNQDENARRSTHALKANARGTTSRSFVRRSGSEKTANIEKRIECLFQRLLPHTIQKTLDKLDRMLQQQLIVRINGRSSTISAIEHPRLVVNTQKVATAFSQSLGSSILHDGGTLSTLKVIDLQSTSARSVLPPVFWKSDSLRVEIWKRVSEHERLGLTMYTLPVGPWYSSCIIALVWTRTSEILLLYLLSHRVESAYHACHRQVNALCDDIDPSYGLHSYTICISVRSLSELLWEGDFHDVEFHFPSEKDCSVVTARLIQKQGGRRDTSLALSKGPRLSFQDDAFEVKMDQVCVFDVGIFDEKCVPVWCFTRAISLRQGYDEMGSFSQTCAGMKCEKLEGMHQEDGPEISVRRFRLLLDRNGSKTAVRQIEVTFGLSFIDSRFSTSYANA